MALPQAFIDLVNSNEVADSLTARDFHAMAATLNAPTERGPVPIRDLSSMCLSLGLTGGVLSLVAVPLGTDLAPGVPMTLQIKGLLNQILTLVQTDYRLESADVDDPMFGPGCDGLIALGLLSAEGKAALLALGHNRRGAAEVALGRPCTAVECWEACGGDK